MQIYTCVNPVFEYIYSTLFLRTVILSAIFDTGIALNSALGDLSITCLRP